jgi:DNA repair and recombination protein RAD52
MLTDEQKTLLAEPLSRGHVKKNPRGYDYVESWRVESEANRIFGHDGWSSVILETKCVMEKERKLGQGNNQYDGYGVTYTAVVRVAAGGQTRDGAGAGHGMDKDLGLAHESAIKEATSDAEKRAFKTFGNPFGLALYDKEQENVTAAPRKSSAAVLAAKNAILESPGEALGDWETINAKALSGLTPEDRKEIMDFLDATRKPYVRAA